MPPYSRSYLARRGAVTGDYSYQARQAVSDSLRMKSRKLALNRRASNLRRARPNAMGVTSYQPSINKQIKALIAAKKKDAADVSLDNSAITATESACLTSFQGFTSTAYEGLLAADADEVLINSVRLKGYHAIPSVVDTNQLNNLPTFVRYLLVWFYKPLLVASAAGTLPPITEVLVTDEIHSLPVSAASNAGRFVVLSDRMWNLGRNEMTVATTTGVPNWSPTNQTYFDYTVKVDKTVKFKSPALAGTYATQGGHYDSDSPQGQVDRGLLVLYQQVLLGNTLTVVNTVGDFRLNYTG